MLFFRFPMMVIHVTAAGLVCIAAEVFVLASKSSYESRGRECLRSSPVSSTRTLQGARKRAKNSSGPDVSPFTSNAQPLSKRSMGGAPGRRLAFEPCETLLCLSFTC